MTTDNRLLSLLSNVRPRAEDRWIARCPAHEDGSPSLALRRTSDRWLIRCWAGCTAHEVVEAIGLTLADLFDDHPRHYRPDSNTERKQRANENLESWRQSELRRIAEELRRRDTIIRNIDATVAEGEMSEEASAISLAYEYRGYSECE